MDEKTRLFEKISDIMGRQMTAREKTEAWTEYEKWKEDGFPDLPFMGC